MNKYVMYTALVGDYDCVVQPEVVDDRFDYILFSNDIIAKNIGIWQIRPIGYHNCDRTKIARWVKTHPELLLVDYECSIWIDASFIVKSSYIYDRVIKLNSANILISTNENPELLDIYQEMCSMMLMRRDTEETIIRWGAFLRNEHYPRWVGTKETGILYRKHSNTNVLSFDKLWWWCIEHYSKRDQFSFSYVLWKLHLECVNFFPATIVDIRHNEHVYLREHLYHPNQLQKDNNYNQCQLMRYYRKHVNERVTIEEILYWLYGRKYPFFWLSIIGRLFQIKHLVLYYLGRENDMDYAKEVRRIKNKI